MVQRPLYIDFQLYTHDDPDFKQELIRLMVNDLLELQRSLHLSLQMKEISVYRKACHKMNSTINMLDDKEFIGIVEDIKQEDSREEKAAFFNKICSEIVDSLEANKKESSSSSNTSNS